MCRTCQTRKPHGSVCASGLTMLHNFQFHLDYSIFGCRGHSAQFKLWLFDTGRHKMNISEFCMGTAIDGAFWYISNSRLQKPCCSTSASHQSRENMFLNFVEGFRRKLFANCNITHNSHKEELQKPSLSRALISCCLSVVRPSLSPPGYMFHIWNVPALRYQR